MNKFLIIFLSIILYKFLTNYIRLKQLQKYEREFIDFLSNKSCIIDEHSVQTINLFKRAGIRDAKIPISQPIGFGQVANFNASTFQNFPMTQRAVSEPALVMFRNATGIYRTRMLESINPIYWTDLIVFLPKNLLDYIGINSDAAAFKLWNAFLTFIWWAICTIAIIFQPEIKSFILEMFTKM